MIKACYYSFRAKRKIYKKFKTRKAFNRAKKALWNKQNLILAEMRRY